MRLVQDFKSNGMWVQSKTLEGSRVITTAGRLWGAILTRTKVRGSFCDHHPSTQQALNLFNNFQEFAEWCQIQENYTSVDSAGAKYQLDKDIIPKSLGIAANYSPDTCIFIPQRINKLLNEQNSSGMSLPLGVRFHKASSLFAATISIDGKSVWIGTYDTPEAASEAYSLAKSEEIVRVAGLYDTGELSERAKTALIVISKILITKEKN